MTQRDDKGLIEAALAIAEERENTTRTLARAVLDKDYETAKRLAKELLPNESRRIPQANEHLPIKSFAQRSRSTDRRRPDGGSSGLLAI